MSKLRKCHFLNFLAQFFWTPQWGPKIIVAFIQCEQHNIDNKTPIFNIVAQDNIPIVFSFFTGHFYIRRIKCGSLGERHCVMEEKWQAKRGYFQP